MFHSAYVSQGFLLISSDFALAHKFSLKATFSDCAVLKVLVYNKKQYDCGSN